jgi:tripartite ATP-independent transporter DctM subunit
MSNSGHFPARPGVLAGGDSGARSLGATLDTLVRHLTEVPAAALVVAEMVLLLVNVICRYALHKPLTWGDELASLLFIWLSMLGAAIALRRGEHLRLTTVLSRMPPRRQQFFDVLGKSVVLAFLLMLVKPAWEYAHEEWVITMLALEIPHSFRVASMGAGVVLMILASLAQLLRRARLNDVALSAAIIAGTGLALWGLKPVLQGLGSTNLLIFFLFGVTVMVTIGVPIMTAFGLATLSYLLSTTRMPPIVMVGRMDEGMSSAILLAVPLFVFLGALIEATGMAAAMIRFLATLVGHLRGGMSYVLVGAMYLVSGISGSKTADMAAVAPALFPEMKKRGDDEGELVAMLSASAAMSETIPPSLVLITIGSVTGVSIAQLFTGGFVPAVVAAIAMSVVIWFKSRNGAGKTARAPRQAVWSAFVYALPALALPFLIRSAVVEGVATPTEVATIGVAFTFIAGLLMYRQLRWSRMLPMLIDTASLSGAILIIIGCATAMAWALTQSGFSGQLAAAMGMVPGGAVGFMLVSALAFIFLGSFLEGIPSIVLFGPLLFPVAHAAGINDVHYAMVVVFAMGLGLFAPPFGIGFYTACAIGKVDPERAIGLVWPYLGALFVALILIAVFPWLSVGFL